MVTSLIQNKMNCKFTISIKNTIIGILLFFPFSFNYVHAQDSSFTLNVEQVLQIVKQYHPVVRQTSIAIQQADANILEARGAFDPLLSLYTTQKTFDGTNYYNYTTPEIKIPTWYGIEVYSGFENLNGTQVDPTQTLGKTSYFGVSIPLAKDLVIDKRRAFLQQAKIISTMAETEQRAMLNNLYMEAINAYWLWVKAFQTYTVIKNNVAINEKRVALVIKSFQNGERPAIDTIEALTQLQNFQYLQNQNWLEFQNAGLMLSAFLWKPNNEPWLLPEVIIPQAGWDREINITKFSIVLDELLATADKNHPELRLYDYKLDVLSIDKKLKFQELLPKIDFQYNQLGKGYDLLKTATTGPLFENNYQYGIKAAVPLRLSQGRAAYKSAKLKIEDTRLDQYQKRLQIQLKIRSYYNEFLNLQNQITLQENMYFNYQKLVNAEETRFSNGESSLFLINSRETKSLDALEKLIETKTKYFKSIYALQWSAGLLVP